MTTLKLAAQPKVSALTKAFDAASSFLRSGEWTQRGTYQGELLVFRGASAHFAITAFRKQLSCPPSETLLSYRFGYLSKPDQEKVFNHLADCEFCGAELQLLDRCPLKTAEHPACELPLSLKSLYEESMRDASSARLA